MSTPTAEDYTTTTHGTVTVGRTVYTVKRTAHPGSDSTDGWGLESTGPARSGHHRNQPAYYWLHPVTVATREHPGGVHRGVYRAVSMYGGSPMRSKGNEVRFVILGDVVEVAGKGVKA